MEIVSQGVEDEARALRKANFIAGQRWTRESVWHDTEQIITQNSKHLNI